MFSCCFVCLSPRPPKYDEREIGHTTHDTRHTYDTCFKRLDGNASSCCLHVGKMSPYTRLLLLQERENRDWWTTLRLNHSVEIGELLFHVCEMR